MLPPSKTFGFMRGNILVLSISGALGMFCRSMVFPYTPLFILSLGGHPAEIGLIYALSPLGGLLFFPIAGYLADRTSRAKIIAFTSYFSSTLFLFNIFAQSWHWIAIARLLQGFAILHHPATSAIVADSLSPENRGRGIATMITASGTLAILAPYVAGILLDSYGIDTGMRILYTVTAVAYTIGATINLLFIQETKQSQVGKFEFSRLPHTFKEAYTDLPKILGQLPRTVKALTIVIILGFIANGIASPFWVIYAKNHIGLSSAQWGLVLLIESTFGNLVRIPVGFLSDRFGRTRFILTSLILCCASIPMFVFARSIIFVIGIRCLVAFTMASFGPSCSALLADTIPKDIRGRVLAAIGRGSVRIGAASGGTGGPGLGFLTIIPLALASLLGGILYEWHPASPWGFVFLISIIAFLISIFLVRDPKKAEI